MFYAFLHKSECIMFGYFEEQFYFSINIKKKARNQRCRIYTYALYSQYRQVIFFTQIQFLTNDRIMSFRQGVK